MQSIRWIRHVLVNGTPCALEVMVGTQRMGDHCYARLNQDPEMWFSPASETRDEIVAEGRQLLYQRLAGAEIQNLDGTPYNWD
jgi:hypothetical protein